MSRLCHIAQEDVIAINVNKRNKGIVKEIEINSTKREGLTTYLRSNGRRETVDVWNVTTRRRSSKSRPQLQPNNCRLYIITTHVFSSVGNTASPCQALHKN
jgi:hypothetical protein